MATLPRRFASIAVLLLAQLFTSFLCSAQSQPVRVPLALKTDDVIPTGNQWISLPTIRAADGALMSFNVLSMRSRGLLQVDGNAGAPVLQPFFTADGHALQVDALHWDEIEYWIPVGTMSVDGVELSITYCAPPDSRGAFIRLTMTNHRSQAVPVSLGMRASWGALSRVTYTPVLLRGERVISEAPWVSPGETFSFITSDTQFAWALVHPDAEAKILLPPLFAAPSVEAQRSVTLAAGARVEADFVLAAGVEEFSAAHNARALRELLDRNGSEKMIEQTAQWCRQRTRTTGRADLDLLMNRNFLFTELYAWGRTIDTEQLVGVTSRSPRYYVSAAYWDRDAMLWSLPALLDTDPVFARQALEYALTVQSRNTGTHSRFIDGIVLEDGFQLDEAVAPIVALAQYLRITDDLPFVTAHRNAIDMLRARLLDRYDARTGLYSTLQDSQDEYQKLPFSTYGNVLTWRALQDFSRIYEALQQPDDSRRMQARADALKQAILRYCVSASAPGATGTIFATSTDSIHAAFTEVPPGSLLKLPELGFISEDDPLFERTYAWLHSKNYPYSFADQPFGLPGSQRLPFTSVWSVADHLRLQRGRDRAMKILLSSGWDGGIITEGVNASTGVMDSAGRAFATAAGYVSHTICQTYCTHETLSGQNPARRQAASP